MYTVERKLNVKKRRCNAAALILESFARKIAIFIAKECFSCKLEIHWQNIGKLKHKMFRRQTNFWTIKVHQHYLGRTSLRIGA